MRECSACNLDHSNSHGSFTHVRANILFGYVTCWTLYVFMSQLQTPALHVRLHGRSLEPWWQLHAATLCSSQRIKALRLSMVNESVVVSISEPLWLAVECQCASQTATRRRQLHCCLEILGVRMVRHRRLLLCFLNVSVLLWSCPQQLNALIPAQRLYLQL